MLRSPTICMIRMAIRPGGHLATLWTVWFVLAAVVIHTCACQNNTHVGQGKHSHTLHAVIDADWTSSQLCDGTSCHERLSRSRRAVDNGGVSPRSLWPFFRDLDLLRLMEEAVSCPNPSPKNERVTQCRADLQIYMKGLRNFSTWAMQMWDSSVRAPRGSIWGELWQMGSFDECLGSLEHRDLREHLPGAAFSLTTLQIHTAISERELRGSAWDIIKPPNHALQISRHKTHWGMCVPSSCGPSELPAVLNGPLRMMALTLGLEASLSVNPRLWQDENGPVVKVATMHSPTAPWTILMWLTTWVLFCTFIETTGKAAWVIQSFSLRRNWAALWAVEQRGSQSLDERDDIALIHVAKVVGVVLVIVGHRGEALMANPILNGNDLEKMYLNLLDIIIINSTAIVDVFFVAGGCLLSWTMLGYMQRGKQVSLTTMYIYRYLRLTPAYAVAIAFLALGLPSLGSGPLWGVTVVEEAHRCQLRWWTNLMYVNNFIHQDKPCLDPAWYLACDTQLFFVAAPLVLLMHSRPRLAARLLGLGAVVGVLYPAVVTWRLGLEGTIIPTPETMGHMATTPIHMHVYVSAACRAGPYFAGLAAGWYLRHIRTQARPAHRAFYWSAPLLPFLALAVMAAGAVFFPPLSATTPRWVHVAYAGLHRTLCAATYAGVAVAVVSREHCGERSKATSSFRPWSRLSYCAFLTHALVQMYFYGQQRAPAVYSTMDVITLSLPDVVFAFLAAMFLHLTVEAPCNALLHSFRARRQGRGTAAS